MDATPKILARAELWHARANGLLAVLGGVSVFFLVGVTMTAVFSRYVLNDPIYGIEDLSTMGMTVVVAGAVAYGADKGSHVSVNVIGMMAGRATTRYTDVLARLLGIGIVSVATYALFTKGSCGLPCGDITNNLSILHWPFYYILGFAMASYAVLLVVHLLIGLARWSGEDPNADAD